MRSLANIITHVTIAIFNFRKRQKMMRRSKLQLVYFKGTSRIESAWRHKPYIITHNRWCQACRHFEVSIVTSVADISADVNFIYFGSFCFQCKTSYGTKTWEELKLKYLLILNFPWIYYGSEQVGSKLLFSVLDQIPHKNCSLIIAWPLMFSYAATSELFWATWLE